MSLYKDLINSCQNRKNDRAIYSNHHFSSYARFIKKVDFYADFFAKVMNFHKENVVSLCLDNSISSLAMIYGLNKIGVIVNLINPCLPVDQILYFDSIIRSRVLILEKSIYQQNYQNLKSAKDKIAVFDDENISFRKVKRNIKFRKIDDAAIPFNVKRRIRRDKYSSLIDDSSLAITAPNERFDSVPYLACFTNKNLHQSLLNNIGLYNGIRNKNVVYIQGSIMSFSMLMTYFHPLLCAGIPIYIDKISENISNETLVWKRFTILCSDEGNLKATLSSENANNSHLIKKIRRIYIYNDLNRDYVFDRLQELCQAYKKHIPLISILGSVETGGSICAANMTEDIIMCFGKFLGDIKPFISKNSKIGPKGSLVVESKANMIGYYKQNVINDELITSKGLNTRFNGAVDEYGRFHLLNSVTIKQTFTHTSLYLFNVRMMLLTIPGINNVEISFSSKNIDTIECIIDAGENETSRITSEVSVYLDNYIKDKNLDYQIIFKR